MIPVSVIVVTRNEGPRIRRCLDALTPFDEVIVVDSESTDNTAALARKSGAKTVSFRWDGGYPKKRGWCLDHLDIRHDFVFFVDADERVTPELTQEIAALDFHCAGYFVKGCYMRGDRPLRFGLKNNKLALINRRKIEFPVIDDLDLPGMGEIEGHYQPVLKPDFEHEKIGALKAHLLHYADEDKQRWRERHRRYAVWEAGMNRKNAWPEDPVAWRQILKRLFRVAPGRGLIAFFHAYIMKGGFLEGRAGWEQACGRAYYYRLIRQAERDGSLGAETSKDAAQGGESPS